MSEDRKIKALFTQEVAEEVPTATEYDAPEPVDQFEEDMEFLKEADAMDAFVSMAMPD
ncbi:hypothetical protein [Sinorhizobium fredii]|nr:hypothetical protein [Sinorhizobium fredii]